MKRKVALILFPSDDGVKNATGDCLYASVGELVAVFAHLAFGLVPDNRWSVVRKSNFSSRKKVSVQPQISAPRTATACGCARSSILLYPTCVGFHFQTALVLSFLLGCTETYKYSSHGLVPHAELKWWFGMKVYMHGNPHSFTSDPSCSHRRRRALLSEPSFSLL